MPDRVGRDGSFGETGIHFSRPGHGDVQTLRDVAPCHRMAIAVGQQGGIRAQCWITPQPSPDFPDGGRPQGRRALFAAFRVKVSTRCPIENHVGYSDADDLRDPCAGVVQQGQQEVVALRGPAVTGLADRRPSALASRRSTRQPAARRRYLRGSRGFLRLVVQSSQRARRGPRRRILLRCALCVIESILCGTLCVLCVLCVKPCLSRGSTAPPDPARSTAARRPAPLTDPPWWPCRAARPISPTNPPPDLPGAQTPWRRPRRTRRPWCR